ncbi:hypothetical protein B0T22DRAFT_412648 [Podospora appendiculata]|uniref:Uncharacterized protein n=1 Tax=Podospora appendiculata TaxID=314037 RepID=A0AAE0X3T3_9PEZI|nr:hypothetical protein B0T22DRAFT_412648 [Podospora appendiculata]
MADCTTIPPSIPSDAGISGAGVLLSSTITAALALLLSASLVLPEFRRSTTTHPRPPPSSTIRRKLLNGYSDQQIMVGIGIQSVGLVKASSLSAYHFFIIWMLSLLSMATHNATLLALVRDFQRDRVLRWLRQGLMFVNLALSCTFGVYVLQAKVQGLPATLPIACAWTLAAAEKKTTVGGLDYVGTIVTIAGNCVIFALATWYLQSTRQRFFKTVQTVGLGLMAAIAIGAAVRVFLLSQAFGTPDVPISDQGEKSWSFGQLLSMLMLILPVVSVVEILRGEIAVAPPVEEEEDVQPLFDGRMADINPKMTSRSYVARVEPV